MSAPRVPEGEPEECGHCCGYRFERGLRLCLSCGVERPFETGQEAEPAPTSKPAPRAEGEPAPLWEWVRAADEEARAMCSAIANPGSAFGPVRRALIWRHDHATVWDALRGEYEHVCTTPAELRAALDKLAAEVSHG